MDNEEDDDGNFTKWMSSYWGHGAGEDHAKERKRSFRRPSRNTDNRRSSLPCMVGRRRPTGHESQLEGMKCHAASMHPSHLKGRDEKEVRSHPRARRVLSDENNLTKGANPEGHIVTIPELSESFERMLRFRNRKVMSLSDADNVCLICHEELRNGGGGGGQELHCSHRFHKEAVSIMIFALHARLDSSRFCSSFTNEGGMESYSLDLEDPSREPHESLDLLSLIWWIGKVRRPEQGARPRSGSSTAVCERRKEVPFCAGQEEYRIPRRQLSLRRQR